MKRFWIYNVLPVFFTAFILSCGSNSRDNKSSWADLPDWAKKDGIYKEDGGLPTEENSTRELSSSQLSPGSEPYLVESPWVLRSDVERILNAGIPLFLQRVPIEAYRPDGNYAGWKILSIDGRKKVSGLHLEAGDTVTLVNGQSVERPEYLDNIWKQLRVASELRLEYTRNGRKIIETIQIVDR